MAVNAKTVFLSRASEKLTGRTVEQITGSDQGWYEVVHPDDLEEVAARNSKLAEGCGADALEYRILRPDGETVYVRDKAAVRQDSGTVYIDAVVEDMTHVRRAELELERTQMLQSIGKLAAGIAHEINTPIQFIGDNLKFLSDTFESIMLLTNEQKQLLGAMSENAVNEHVVKRFAALEEAADLQFITEETPQAIEQSLEGIKRVSTIVAAMRDFSHIDERRMARADINKALESCLIMLRNEVKYVADVTMEFDAKLPSIFCCIDELNQVFMNLIINAAHSITEKVAGSGERGVITVRTEQQDNYAVVTIADTGIGIDAKISDRIFEPFFTTKPRGKGTGQGLAMAKTLLERKHKGTIRFKTEPGVGTSFIIRLPI